MRITRLAATGAVCGAAALALAAPARAAAEPKITITPEEFRPGDNLTISVTECQSAPVTGRPGMVNQIFAENPAFTRDGDGWQAIGGTGTGLKPGQPYRTEFRCRIGTRPVTFTLTATPHRAPSPSPSPDDFEFGFDKVKLSTRTVTPGGEMTFTVTCPTEVSARSASFVKVPKFTKDGEDAFKGTATFKETLPSIVNIKVTCEGHGHVTYSTRPDEDDLGDGGPEIPKGAPDTGGGTGGQGPGATAFGGAALTLLAGAGLGAWTLRRRAGGSAESP
jgi:hypothetical protein